MLTTKVYIAYLITLFRFKMGLGLSQRKMFILLDNIYNPNLVYSLLFNFFNSSHYTDKNLMIGFLLSNNKVSNDNKRILFLVLSQKDFAKKYMDYNLWTYALELNKGLAHYRSAIGFRKPDLFYCDGSLALTVKLLKVAHGELYSNRPALYLLHNQFGICIEQSSYSTATIADVLTNREYGEFLANDSYSIYSRLLSIIARYAKDSEYGRVFNSCDYQDKSKMRYHRERSHHLKHKPRKKQWRK